MIHRSTWRALVVINSHIFFCSECSQLSTEKAISIFLCRKAACQICDEKIMILRYFIMHFQLSLFVLGFAFVFRLTLALSYALRSSIDTFPLLTSRAFDIQRQLGPLLSKYASIYFPSSFGFEISPQGGMRTRS